MQAQMPAGGGFAGAGAPAYASKQYGPSYTSLVERQRRRNGVRHKLLKGNGISERELFEGDRDGEKRAEEKLDQLLLHDRYMQRRMMELGGFMQELRTAMAHR
jgi:hypothetical protein